MAERGAVPQVPVLQRRALKAIRGLFTPLLPDDYLELINPLWSTQELRGRIERVERETNDAATIFIKPGWEWPSHDPGQYRRIGVVIDGVHHWRAYSLTSDPGRPDGCISITPKLVEEGVVSPFFVRQAKPGAIVRLGGVEGTFMLPSPLPDKLLFITAGSGSGSLKVPSTSERRTIVPGRAWRTSQGVTTPSSTSLGVMLMSPSGRPGSDVSE